MTHPQTPPARNVRTGGVALAIWRALTVSVALVAAWWPAIGGVNAQTPSPTPAPAVAADNGRADSRPAPADAGPVLLAKVNRHIGRAQCSDDMQCRSLALGARACGGPEAYVAWSVLGTDAAAVKRAAERYTQWQTQAQSRSNAQSICMIEVDPGAVCVRPASPTPVEFGRCVLGGGAGRDASR